MSAKKLIDSKDIFTAIGLVCLFAGLYMYDPRIALSVNGAIFLAMGNGMWENLGLWGSK